jgi:Rrf2 family protein
MRLSRASAYGVFATIYIAEKEKDSPIPGQNIAETCSIPPGHLLKVLQQLVKSRILSSERGPSGGFALRRPPNKITMLDIIESIEGPIEGEFGGSEDVSAKGRAKNGVKKLCDDVANFTRNHLRKTTVSDLMG